MEDGISLHSAEHPRGGIWKRIWTWVFPPRISRGSLEMVEIELPDGIDYERSREQAQMANDALKSI